MSPLYRTDRVLLGADLDADTRAETALPSWRELVGHCTAGYVPTIPGTTAAQRRLREALVALGLRVWPEMSPDAP